MGIDREQPRVVEQTSPAADDLVGQLAGFDGPPEQFLALLLATQCRLAQAAGGAILRPGAQGRTEALVVHPPLPAGERAPLWLAQAMELAPGVLTERQSRSYPFHQADQLYGQPADRQILLLPITTGGQARGVAAFLISSATAAQLDAIRQRLELSLPLLSLYEMRLTLQRRQGDMRRLRKASETVSTIGQHGRFHAAAMTFCNELAARWDADRVSLGFLSGRYVKLRATSHTEKFSRKMALIQAIESAMEECLDQDVEVLHPSGSESGTVTRATAELARGYGPTAVVSLPLRRDGEVIGVVTAERPAESPFTADQVETMRLTCDLCTPWLARLHETDRWFGARWAAGARKGLAAVLGPRHTWIKVAVLAVAGLLLFSVLARGDREAKAPYTLEPTQRRVVTVPWDGELVELGEGIEPGATVAAGDLLGAMDTSDLRWRLAQAQSEVRNYEKQADQAISERKPAEQQIAQAQADRARAEVALLEEQIRRARLTAPIGGVVLSGDWAQQLGRTFEAGDPLFEIAPTALRAQLDMDEADIVDVRVGQGGELANPADPDQKVAFTVTRISPVAEVVDGRNVFKVRIRLEQEAGWMKPGLEGPARIHLGEDRYITLWTRPLVNWVRMKLWW